MVISDQQTRTTNTNNRVLPGFLHKMVGLCFRKTKTCQNGLQPVVQNSSLEQQMVLGLSMPWFCLPKGSMSHDVSTPNGKFISQEMEAHLPINEHM